MGIESKSERGRNTLDPAGTRSVASGSGIVNYKRLHEPMIPFPSPPQEVVLARAGGGLSGCREADTVVARETWNAGGGGFGCPVCRREVVRVQGEFWRDVAAGVRLPGGDDEEVLWVEEDGDGGVKEAEGELYDLVARGCGSP
jgi:hypothetical protein